MIEGSNYSYNTPHFPMTIFEWKYSQCKTKIQKISNYNLPIPLEQIVYYSLCFFLKTQKVFICIRFIQVKI